MKNVFALAVGYSENEDSEWEGEALKLIAEVENFEALREMKFELWCVPADDRVWPALNAAFEAREKALGVERPWPAFL